MARKDVKYHYIYKITCLKNNRYYIGMHSTNNLDDGYMGGGKRIKNSVKKHGKDAHKKEILEFFENRELLRQREIELVNEELLKDTMCMNINRGGEGGWMKEWSSKGAKSANAKNWKNPEFIKKIKDSSSKTFKKLWEDPYYRGIFINAGKNAFKGKSHTDEFKERMSETMKGKYNGDLHPQYGSIWITKERVNKKIKDAYLDDHLKDGWIIGRYTKSSIDDNTLTNIIKERNLGKSYRELSSIFNIQKTTIIRIIKNYNKFNLI